ncbi:MAG TPA: formyltetrahydrofolate deformylase [Solirubrobacteraceae bacterium]
MDVSHETRAAAATDDRGAGLPQAYTARLLIGCADRPGIVAAVSGFLFEQGANIVSSHQYSTDPIGGRFFLRTEFFLPRSSRAVAATGGHPETGVGTGTEVEAKVEAAAGTEVEAEMEAEPEVAVRERLHEQFEAEVATRFAMDWRIRWWGERRRIAILVSRHDHCLVELLWRWRRGELDAEIVAVVSNHLDLQRETLAVGVPYHHIPVEKGHKAQAEGRMLELLAGNADLLVLARYMQILSGDFLARVAVPAINIHHSFLPAFAGADPYRRAREQGVKLIGATAHYVTEQLDDGPIIEQDVVRVDHRQSIGDLERVGRDIERLVLARAVSMHLDDRVIVDGRRTIVF